MNRREFIAISSVGLTAACSSTPSTAPAVGRVSPGLPRIAHPWPVHSFSLPDLDGKIVRSSDLVGNVLILRFWATW